jgi:hypothetical protein
VDERLAVSENRAGPEQCVLEGRISRLLHFLGRRPSSRARLSDTTGRQPR